jgi:hypothetical protein
MQFYIPGKAYGQEFRLSKEELSGVLAMVLISTYGMAVGSQVAQTGR